MESIARVSGGGAAMAEQRPYRISGSAAQPQLGRVKRLELLSLAGAFIAINWVTTQHAGRVLSYASWLGQPLFRLPWTGSVYWPLSLRGGFVGMTYRHSPRFGYRVRARR